MDLTSDQILYCALFFGIVALSLTIYGQVSFLKPKDANGNPMEPTKTQKTNGWLLTILPWFIPLGLVLYYVYSTNKLTPTEEFFKRMGGSTFAEQAGLRR